MSKDIVIKKVGTYDNIADALTKYVSGDVIRRHVNNINAYISNDRHRDAPAVDQ